MPHELEYAPARFKPVWAGYLPFVGPPSLIVLTRFFYKTAAELIAATQHPADIFARSRLVWSWESRIVDAMGWIMTVTAVFLILPTILAFVPKTRYWLNARIPGWTFFLIINWLILILVGSVPIGRS